MLKFTMASLTILLTTVSSINATTLASTQPEITPIYPSEMTLPPSSLFKSLNLDENPSSLSIISETNSLTEQSTPLKPSEESVEIHEGSPLLGLLFIGILGGIQLLFSHLIMSDRSNNDQNSLGLSHK